MYIAATVDGDGNAIPFGEPGAVILFNREDDEWCVVDRFACDPGEQYVLGDLKESVQALATKLGGCRTMLVRDVSGYSRTKLLELGFTLWSIEGRPERYLDRVLQLAAEAAEARAAVVTEEQASVPKELSVPKPLDGSCSGIYTIDISEAQVCGGNHNSREILIPFFRTTRFSRIDIICDHVPKWFSSELAAMKLNYSARPVKNGRWLVSVLSSEHRNGHRSGCSSCG
jgi:Fe-only nitrogenase accessory protein AnfO